MYERGCTMGVRICVMSMSALVTGSRHARDFGVAVPLCRLLRRSGSYSIRDTFNFQFPPLWRPRRKHPTLPRRRQVSDGPSSTQLSNSLFSVPRTSGRSCGFSLHLSLPTTGEPDIYLFILIGSQLQRLCGMFPSLV